MATDLDFDWLVALMSSLLVSRWRWISGMLHAVGAAKYVPHMTCISIGFEISIFIEMLMSISTSIFLKVYLLYLSLLFFRSFSVFLLFRSSFFLFLLVIILEGFWVCGWVRGDRSVFVTLHRPAHTCHARMLPA